MSMRTRWLLAGVTEIMDKPTLIINNPRVMQQIEKTQKNTLTTTQKGTDDSFHIPSPRNTPFCDTVNSL